MINKVLIIGLGAVGSIYASKIKNSRILVDDKRKKFYKEHPTNINNKEYSFNFITKEEKEIYDLVIVATKNYSLNDALINLEGFVGDRTIIISLLNGISSERIIQEKFPQAKVILSYLICHSMMRNGRNICHDNINKIVCDKNEELESFFEKNNINYERNNNIKQALWQKFMLNVSANQLNSVTKKTFGELQKLSYINDLLYKIMEEIVQIAKACGIDNANELRNNAIKDFWTMLPEGKTSMLQDIEANRPTELDAFAGEIIQLGKKYNIKTPYNNLFYYLLSQN